MDAPMNQITVMSLLSLMVMAPILKGQTPPNESTSDLWVSGLVTSGNSIDIRYQLELTPNGWQVQFRNFSDVPVHFGFYLEGVQTPDSAASNGRVHILPRKVAAPFIPGVDQHQGQTAKPRLVNIRIEQDEGPFWRE